MNKPPEIEPPKNILRKTLIFLMILLAIWVIGAIYVLTPRPLTNDPESHSAPIAFSQHLLFR